MVAWQQPASGGHAVFFYDDSGSHYERVAECLAGGLANGHGVIVAARQSTCDGLRAALERRGFDVTAAQRKGQIEMLEATTTLEAVLADGMPERSRFRQAVGRPLDRVLRACGRACVYGELVDLLAERGRLDAAAQLETLW